MESVSDIGNSQPRQKPIPHWSGQDFCLGCFLYLKLIPRTRLTHCPDDGGSKVLKTMLNFYQTTWHYNPEDSHLHIVGTFCPSAMSFIQDHAAILSVALWAICSALPFSWSTSIYYRCSLLVCFHFNVFYISENFFTYKGMMQLVR
jgi:hypothetical protein